MSREELNQKCINSVSLWKEFLDREFFLLHGYEENSYEDAFYELETNDPICYCDCSCQTCPYYKYYGFVCFDYDMHFYDIEKNIYSSNFASIVESYLLAIIESVKNYKI